MMEFRVLGPIEVRSAERTLDAGHGLQRAVLAVLLLEAGRVVPAERLIDRVWGENPPPAVRSALYGYIARLRAMLAAAADGGEDADSAGRSPDAATLSRSQGGYLLQAEPGQLDLHQFRQLAGQATQTTGDQAAEQLLRQALELWHGPALTGVHSPWLTAMRDTLELERRAAVLDLNDVRLRLGHHAALTAELAAQAAATPADERLIGQLMLALYRSGRQADALRQFDQTRRDLATELGTDPAPQLTELHQQILHADPALAVAPPGTRSTPAAASTPGAAGSQVGVSAAAVPVPRELPADVTAFTGRATELDELDELLLGGRAGHHTAAVISAVSGTAGVGKTALAVHWAHHAAGRFPDGQLYVNLRGYDTDQPVTATDALAAFLRSLGMPGQEIPPEEAERATRYRTLLAGKRTLIVLDNAATVQQVRPLLPGHPGCRVVVTSRDSLGGLVARDGARRLDLDLLPLADAVTLLRELIGAKVDAEPDAAVALAEQCTRLPLALRITAELAASRRQSPLAELVTELSDQRQRLDLLSSGGDPRTAVRAVFSWSYVNLDHDAARAFRLIGLHPGPDLDAYALAALADRTVDQATRALGTLARSHLLQPTTLRRYTMHDLLRAYARELAASYDSQRQRQLALARLRDFYLRNAAAAMDLLYPAEQHSRPRIPPAAFPAPFQTDAAAALGWLDAERPVLVNAVCNAGHADHTFVTDLSGTLFRYLDARGHLPEADTIHQHAQRAARQCGDHGAEAEALTGLGATSWRQGRYEDASRQYQNALDLYRDAGSQNGQARSLNNLGMVSHQRGHYELADGYYQQALALYRETGQRTGQAFALNNLGLVNAFLGRYQQAADHHQEALQLHREDGNRNGEALVLDSLGLIDAKEGRYQQAAENHQRALELHRGTGNRNGEACALSNLGVASDRLGLPQQAADCYQRAVDLFRATGERYGEADALNNLGAMLLAVDRPDEARACHTLALSLASDIGHAHVMAGAYAGLGRTCTATGDPAEARGYLEQAVRLFTELGVPEADEAQARLDALTADEIKGG